MEIKIISPAGDELQVVPELPEIFRHGQLEQAEVLTGLAGFGTMSFQHLDLGGIHIWKSSYLATHSAEIRAREDLPVIELHTAQKNHFISNWDGIGQPSLKSMQFNFSYTPHVLNTVWMIGGQQYETFDFHFSFEVLQEYAIVYPILSEFLEKVAKKEPAHLSVECLMAKKMQFALTEMAEFDCRPGIYRKIMRAKAEIFLTMALEVLSAANPVKAVRISTELKEKAYQARTILETRLSDPPSIAELARLTMSNVRSIQVAFTHFFGTTIDSYSKDVRLAYAKKLLVDTNLDLDAIADETGYNDGPGFSRFFKSRVGCTPGEFRKFGKKPK